MPVITFFSYTIFELREKTNFKCLSDNKIILKVNAQSVNRFS